VGHLWVSAHGVAPTPTSPQNPEEAEGPWRRPTNPKHTYRWERKEGDGEDGEAGGDGLPHPRLWHLVPVADGGDRDLRAGGQQVAISPRTSARASVQPEAPPPETCCMHTEARERALHRWAGQLRGQSPSPQGLEPKPNATKEASPRRVHGSSASLHHPTPCRGGPPPRRPGAPIPGPSSTESLATDGTLLLDASLGTRCFMRPSFWENQTSRLVHGGAAVRPGCVPEQRGGDCYPLRPPSRRRLACCWHLRLAPRASGLTLAVPAGARTWAVGCLLGFRGVSSELGKGTQGAQSPSSSCQHMHTAL